jgi:internalin A
MAAKVTDAGLDHLNTLSNLRILMFDRTATTGAGLVPLEKQTKLRTLELSNTQVTDAGVQALQKALPTSGITR